MKPYCIESRHTLPATLAFMGHGWWTWNRYATVRARDRAMRVLVAKQQRSRRVSLEFRVGPSR